MVLSHGLDVVEDALIEKNLTNKGFNCGMMTRQEARDAARLQIGDTGLIDCVLILMDNVLVGGLLVNKSTRISDVYEDPDLLYRNVLKGSPASGQIRVAVQKPSVPLKEWHWRSSGVLLVVKPPNHEIFQFIDMETGASSQHEYPDWTDWEIIGSDFIGWILMRNGSQLSLFNVINEETETLPGIQRGLGRYSKGCFRRGPTLVFIIDVSQLGTRLFKYSHGAWVLYLIPDRYRTPVENIILGHDDKFYWLRRGRIYCWSVDHLVVN